MTTKGICRVCAHPRRAYWDALILGGSTIRDLWRNEVAPLGFCSESTLNKHVRQHAGEGI